MFDEEDLDAEALLVQGDDGTSVPLDRLQVRVRLFFGGGAHSGQIWGESAEQLG